MALNALEVVDIDSSLDHMMPNISTGGSHNGGYPQEHNPILRGAEKPSTINVGRTPASKRLTSPRAPPPSQYYLAREFIPFSPDETPDTHFPLQTSAYSPTGDGRAVGPRFVNRYDSREMMIIVDGSCIGNHLPAHIKESLTPGGCTPGGTKATAGAAFMFSLRLPEFGVQDPQSQPLYLDSPAFFEQGNEWNGPVSFQPPCIFQDSQIPGIFPPEAAPHSSNRAKLSAVIAALSYKAWETEGWRKIVVATDLAYIVHGATKWIAKWIEEGWRPGKNERKRLKRKQGLATLAARRRTNASEPGIRRLKSGRVEKRGVSASAGGQGLSIRGLALRVKGGLCIEDLEGLQYPGNESLIAAPVEASKKASIERPPQQFVANKDLWEQLQRRIERLRTAGTEVEFWLFSGKKRVKNSTRVILTKAAGRKAARR